jgi:uncharacterized protein (TIGR02145 family)
MKKHIISFILFIQTNLLFSQAPVVSNVGFSQRTDGSLKVDITYDVTAIKVVDISVVASDDGGTTWDLTCASLTGNVGSGVTPGTNKQIVWDFYTDNPGVSGSNYKVRVTADDNLETGTMTGNNGKTYRTVKIGGQWWMAENLKETEYRDHSTIPNVTDELIWKDLSTDAYCAYNNNESTANTYGYLYNWYAVNDSRNIAPAGWHVPTDAEWTTLSTYLGGEGGAGGKLKEKGTTHWTSPNTGATNQSGFTALPGGYRDYIYGYFYYLGDYAYFWSSTGAGANDAYHRKLNFSNSDLNSNYYNKQNGFSVRLLKD